MIQDTYIDTLYIDVICYAQYLCSYKKHIIYPDMIKYISGG